MLNKKISEQEINDTIKHIKQIAPCCIKEFQEVKFENIIYKEGEVICVKNEDNEKKDKIFGKIYKILLINTGEELLPIIIFFQYFTKHNLKLDNIENIQQNLSQNELFPSKKQRCCRIEAIIYKCEMLSMTMYESFPETEDYQYFSRSKYDYINRKFYNPSYEECKFLRKKLCYCKQPSNPDREYVLCEKCENWFHSDCISQQLQLSYSQINNKNFNFVCKQCKRIKQ